MGKYHYEPFNEIHIDHPSSSGETFVVSRQDPDWDRIGPSYTGLLTQCGMFAPRDVTLPYGYTWSDFDAPTCMGCILANLQTSAEAQEKGRRLARKLWDAVEKIVEQVVQYGT